MSDDLETLYKVLAREQTTGYSGSSVLGSFEEFVAGWCDKVLAGSNDQQSDLRQARKHHRRMYVINDRETYSPPPSCVR